MHFIHESRLTSKGNNNLATQEQIEFLSGYKKSKSEYMFCFNHLKDKQMQFK